MKPDFYLPILKSKEGEFNALARLDAFTRNHICPLLEVSRTEYDNEIGKKPKTLQDHLYNFCEKKFIGKWHSENSFIDTFLLDGQTVNGMSCMEYIFAHIYQTILQVVPMPVIHLNESLQQRTGTSNVIQEYQVKEIGIRLLIEDAMDIRLEEKLQEILKYYDISYPNCHLIFDLADSDYTEYSDFAEGIVALLNSFPNLDDWKSFTICAGAFPKSDLLKKGTNIVVRLDWKLFKLVRSGLNNTAVSRPINYGDYSIVTPGHFEFDPRKMKRSANIRYTAGDNWIVLKGSALQKPGDNAQYFEQAAEICGSSYYFGENYSKGDTHLKKCVLRQEKAGSPTIWNWVGNNHHFTAVIADLFSNPDGF